jgi:hypothetical protein
MPELFSVAAGDGPISLTKNQSGAWAACRTAGTASSFSTLTRSANGASTQNVSSRGSEVASIQRAFFSFDTSGISVAPSAATLKIYGFFRGTADVIAVRSAHSSTLVNGDFDALHNSSTELGNSDGSGTGTLASVSGLTYSAEISLWSTSGYNDIVLNSTALSDMASLSTFKVAVIDYDRDYLDVAPVGSLFVAAGMYFADSSGTTRDPKIDYTAGAAGYGNAVIGVTSGNIAAVNGVATANIEKVNGV